MQFMKDQTPEKQVKLNDTWAEIYKAITFIDYIYGCVCVSLVLYYTLYLVFGGYI